MWMASGSPPQMARAMSPMMKATPMVSSSSEKGIPRTRVSSPRSRRTPKTAMATAPAARPSTKLWVRAIVE